jgi:A118 family predicted phage portal protein
MPLPAPGSPWPPPQLAAALDQFRIWDAWWAGDPAELAAVYGGTYAGGGRVGSNRAAQYSGGVVGALARMWWGRPSAGNEPEEKLHIPLAGDLARTAAEMLFSEPAKVTADDAAANARIEELLDEDGHAHLIESAEIVAALGGGYLRPVYDVEVADKAWLDCVAPDAAIPVWRWGRLVEVAFWREVLTDDDVVYRHFELHIPGFIEHALYRGGKTELGRMVPLQDAPATADLADLVDQDGRVPTGYDRLDVSYVPHMRPNRAWRRVGMLAPMGRSVLAGCEPMLDALDMTWSSWMRDIDLARGKVIVPETWLDDRGPGRGATFDPNRRFFVPVPGALKLDKAEVVQFAIRVEEHDRTAKSLVEQVLRHAGYSMGTVGEVEETGGMKTATEVTADERRSFITRGRQIGYWRPRLVAEILPALLAVDAYAFGRPTPALDGLNVEFADSVQEDTLTLANTVNLLNTAMSASIETRVRMLHPEWDEQQVADEVALIRDDQAAAMPAPFDYGTGPNDPGETADQRAQAGGAGA